MKIVQSLALLMTICFSIDASRASDQVYVRQKKSDTSRQYTGQIDDWNGRYLVLTSTAGRQRKLTTASVVSVGYDRGDAQVAGQEAFSQHNWGRAIKAYEQALRSEKRDWVRRRILRDVAICHLATNRPVAAAESFERILASDPTTQYLDALPLAWSAQEPTGSLGARADEWMDGNSPPSMMLLGASWQLSGAERQPSIRVLEQLARSHDRRLAGLAMAQLWRTQVVTAKERDFQRWQTAINEMDAPLRPGPIFVLARARARNASTPEAAVIDFMRVPILYPDNYQLAAKALLEAGQLLERGQQRDEAALVYREITQQYEKTDEAALATERLEQLEKL